MARQTIIQLRDDIDGSVAVKTVKFAWSGSTYEIDLSSKNSKAFEQAIAPYIASARRVTGARRGPGRRAASAAAGARQDLTAVRAWAAKNGHAVAARGRIPAAILEAFHAAESGLSGAASAAVPAKKTARPAAKKAAAKKATAKSAPARKSTARKAGARKAAPRKSAR